MKFSKIIRSKISILKKPIIHLWQRPSSDDPIIDGLRGLSILMIILFHSFYGVMVVLKKPEPILAFIRSLPAAASFCLGADKAVDIFFMLSAFLLGSSLFRTTSEQKNLSISEFYLKRLARIYPLFLLAIILYFPVNISRSWRNLPINLVFLDNFSAKSIIPVGWSLSIEMQFYFVLPWLTMFLFKFQPSTRFKILWSVFLSSMLIPLIVCFQYPVIYKTHFYQFHPDTVDPTTMMDSIYYPTQTRFGPLILGLILALRGQQKMTPPKAAGFTTLIGLGLMLAMLNFPVYKPESFYYKNFSETMNLFLQSWHRNIFSFGLWLVLIGFRPNGAGESLINSQLRRVLSIRILRPFAQTVFPIYLFHFPMIALAGIIVFGTTQMQNVKSISFFQVGGIFVLAAILSLILGTLLHITIEKPCMEKGYRLAKKFHRKATS